MHEPSVFVDSELCDRCRDDVVFEFWPELGAFLCYKCGEAWGYWRSAIYARLQGS